MIRTVVKLAIVALVLHAAYRVGMAYWTFYQFRDEVQAVAQFAGDRTESEVRQNIMELAARRQIPLDAAALKVRMIRGQTFVDAEYVDEVEVLPRYKRQWPFKISLSVFVFKKEEGQPGLVPK